MSTILMLLGTLFTCAALYNLATPAANAASAAIGLGLGLTCLGAGSLIRKHNAARREFAEWLAKNRDAIEREEGIYEGMRIDPRTRITSFTMVFSFLVMTFSVKTRYYFADAPDARRGAAVPTIITLLLGWWGFPWGIIRTIQATSRNLAGGEYLTVGDLLSETAVTQAA